MVQFEYSKVINSSLKRIFSFRVPNTSFFPLWGIKYGLGRKQRPVQTKLVSGRKVWKVNKWQNFGKSQLSRLQIVQFVTRGQWPYRPAATRAMTDDHMVMQRSNWSSYINPLSYLYFKNVQEEANCDPLTYPLTVDSPVSRLFLVILSDACDLGELTLRLLMDSKMTYPMALQTCGSARFIMSSLFAKFSQKTNPHHTSSSLIKFLLDFPR